MIRTIAALALTLFASSLAAEERIYVYTSYKDNDKTSVQRKIDCIDSQCTLEDRGANRSIKLSQAQRDEILAGIKAEAQRFNTKTTSGSGDWTLRVKARYQTERGRLEITRDLRDGQFGDMSPELSAVIKTHLGQDLFGSASAELPAEEGSAPAARSE